MIIIVSQWGALRLEGAKPVNFEHKNLRTAFFRRDIKRIRARDHAVFRIATDGERPKVKATV